MRQARIKLNGEEGYYHVMSRIVRHEFWLVDSEKTLLLEDIRRAATFCGVEILTYALMDNHFHLLIRVPPKKEVDEDELRLRMASLYGAQQTDVQFTTWANWARKGRGDQVEAAKARLKARMNDLSQFCKTFKERYTQAFNRRHKNTGADTIWGSRFQRILLEGSDGALMSVAAYIHLNPVRAGIVTDAKSSPWTGLGAAIQGNTMARTGLVTLASHLFGSTSWEGVLQVCLNAVEGRIGNASPASQTPLHAQSPTFPTPPLSPLHALLRSRCTGFSRGGALGSPVFLKRLISILPPRIRPWHTPKPAGFLALGLASPLGVREPA